MIIRFDSHRKWFDKGRLPASFLALLGFSALLLPVMIAGGDRGNDRKIVLEVPSCIPLKGEVRAKMTASVYQYWIHKEPYGACLIYDAHGNLVEDKEAWPEWVDTIPYRE